MQFSGVRSNFLQELAPAVSVLFLYCLLKPILQGLVALMVVGFTYCAVLSLCSFSAYKQLSRLQQLLMAGVFTKLGLQAEFFQIVIYNSLNILQRCLRDSCKPISNFLNIFFLVKFIGGISLASSLYQCSDVKHYLYRYIVCSNCLYILQSAEF